MEEQKDIGTEQKTEEKEQKTVAQKIDKVVFKFMYVVSIFAAIALMVCAVLCTVDSLSTAIFSFSIPNGTEWVTYLNIPIVFLAMGYLQVERGNTVVDLLSRKFPKVLNIGMQIFGNVLGAVLSGYLAYCEFGLTISKFTSLTRSSASGDAFYVWPFALCIAIGYALVATAFAWCAVRVITIPPEKRMGAMPSMFDVPADTPNNNKDGEVSES